METRLTKEALLRQLLDPETKKPNDIYAYFLGYRLFQSPEQLLRELQLRINGKGLADSEKQFMRRSHRGNSRSQGSACSRCHKRQEKPMMCSKSTNNMLDRESPTTYVEMLRANVMMQATGRQLPSVSSTDSETVLSPAASSEISSETLGKSSDFDSYCDLNAIVFDEDNRRNTAPPAALRALSSPRKLEKYSQSIERPKGTDFSTKAPKTNFVSTASMGVLFEKLPETNIDEVQVADGVVASGEDTIRRRKKGRRRTTISDLELPIPDPVLEPVKDTSSAIADRRSVASRDSGILSGVLEHDIDLEYHNNNNNNTKRNTPHQSTSTASTSSAKTSEDSGLISQPSKSVTDTLEQLSKDIEAQICSHLCDEKVVPNDAHARQLHLLHVLLVWVRDFPSDFQRNETLGTLRTLIGSLEKDCQEMKDHCAKVLDTLSESATVRAAYKKHASQADVLSGVDEFQQSKEAMITMVTNMNDVGDAYMLAEQLCLIEMDLLSHLGAEEFLQMFNSNGDEESKSNLGESVRWFNHLSHLVATTVCLCRKPKHRRQVISLFTKAAARCYELSNFNSAMAVLTGLSLGAVARLKRTWSKVDTTEMEQLQSVFDPSNNFRRYRAMFNSRWAAMRSQQEAEEVKLSPVPENNRYSTASQHSVTSRSSVASVTSQHRDSGIECENESASSSAKSPETTSSTSSPKRKFTFDDITSMTGIEDGVLVPFLTLMVKDVYFLNHSTPTIEHDGTINFEKLRHLGEILRPLETWKNTPCVYKKEDKLQDFLLNSPVLKDTELYNLSYKREPPKNKFEKNQLKTIKAELEYSKRGNMVRRMIARRKTM